MYSYADWRREIESYTDAVEVLFHTDVSGSDMGWRLEWGKYKVSIIICCYSFYLTGIVGKSGILTSPNYPQPYPNNHISTQSIEVAEGKTIRFSFTYFDTEQGCDCDYVRILDSNDDNLTHELFGQYILYGPHGTPNTSFVGKDYSTDSNSLQVEFTTDNSGRGKGWRLTWTEQ